VAQGGTDNASGVIDADGHVDPAGVLDWRGAVGPEFGHQIEQQARHWHHLTAGGSSIRRGAWDPQARLADMDTDGIGVAVLFGSSRNIESIAQGHPELHPAIARAFNDWLHGYCQSAPDRLKATAWVPLVGSENGCDEARRAVEDLGVAGIVVNPCLDERSLDHPDYLPLYALLEELDAPLLVHATGAVGDFLVRRYGSFQRQHAVAFPLSLMMATMDLVLGGVLERFPRLRVALLEGGVGWVPWWLDRLDEHYELQPFAAQFIEHSPSELVHRYIAERRLYWSCEPEESQLANAISVLGPHAVVFASDYPHWDCTFPGAPDAVRNRGDLDDVAKTGLLGDNARSLYRIATG
jgi:predicted TIM-barrel fold metal-dependent hydrolase